MRIILDAMGGDNAPGQIVEGALRAVKDLGHTVVLVGDREKILSCLRELGAAEPPAGLEIVHAPQVVEMEDDPAAVIRQKKDSSLVVGLTMLRDGEGDAFVSAGSTGALLSGATLIVKRVRGIRRAAMAPVLPTLTGRVVLTDCGANAECTPEYLLQFAYMGAFYAENVLGIPNPRVGLVNIGTEESKGDALHKEAWQLLTRACEEGRIRFVGNVESRGVMLGDCDVAVCDGFSGNVLLKGIEGTAKFFSAKLKTIFKKNLVTKLGALTVLSGIGELKREMDPSEIGGTMLLGIEKPVVKAHGSSDAAAIRNAVRQAAEAVTAGVADRIRENVALMKVDAPRAEN